MAFASGSSSSISAEINVTPLIDVLLVLLIIFMVIVPVAAHGLDSATPQPSKSQSRVSAVVLSVHETPNGFAYALNAQSVVPSSLRSTLASIFAARQDRSLFVRADNTLSYGQVAFAIGEAKAAGAQTVALMHTETH